MATYADPLAPKKKPPVPGVSDVPVAAAGPQVDAQPYQTNVMAAPKPVGGTDVGGPAPPVDRPYQTNAMAAPSAVDRPPPVNAQGPDYQTNAMPLGNPAQAPPVEAQQPGAPGGEDLYTVMKRRMDAVQAGQPDPGIGGWAGGNPAAAPVADTSAPPMDTGPMMAPPGDPGQGTANGQTPGGPVTLGNPAQAPPVEAQQPGAPGSPNGPAAPAEGRNATYQNALLRMLDQASTPASLADPALKAQSDAAAVGLQRGTDAGRAALAERMAQTGGAGTDSGAFNNELAGLFTGQGETQAGINAGLVGDANKAKVQQLQSALSMMGSDINSEQGRALTRELAQAQMAEASKEFEANFGLEGKRLAESMRQFDTTTQAGKDAAKQQLEMFREAQAQQGKQFDVDAALKKLGITSQAELGSRDIALRDKLGSGGLNAQIMQMLLQNQQFGQGEAGVNARFGAGLNQDALLRLLGGL